MAPWISPPYGARNCPGPEDEGIQTLCAGAARNLYHLRVDPLPSRYDESDQAAQKIIKASLKMASRCH